MTKQALTTLSLYNPIQVINKPNHKCGHIIYCVVGRPDDDIHMISIVTYQPESGHDCVKSYFNV